MDTEYPETADVDYSEYPLKDLLSHKEWKARKVGYERLRDLSATSNLPDPLQYVELIPSFLKEPNVAVLEVAFEALHGLLKQLNVPHSVEDSVLSTLCEKGLSGRPRALRATLDALVELVTMGNGQAVVEVLLLHASSKSPKGRHGVLQAVRRLLQEFGSVFDSKLKPLLKSLTTLVNDSDKNVRREALGVFVELYRHIGDAIRPFLADLRDVQKEELEKEFAGISNTQPQNYRPLHGNLPDVAVTKASFIHDESQTVPTTLVAATPLADIELHDATPVLSKLPKAFIGTVMNKGLKWQERNEMVQENLTPLIKAPRLKEDDYTELVKCLRSLVLDSQLPLQVVGIRSIGSLASGLSTHFSPYVRLVAPCLFDKFKEKKKGHLEALWLTLNTFLDCVLSFSDIFDDWEVAVTSKVPHQRVNALEWACAALTKHNNATHTNRIHQASNLIKKLLSDDKAEVRSSSQKLQSVLNGCKIENQAAKTRPEVHEPLRKIHEKDARVRERTPSKLQGGTHAKLFKTVNKEVSSLIVDQSPAKVNTEVKPYSFSETIGLESKPRECDEAINDLTTCFPHEIITQLSNRDWSVRRDAVRYMLETVRSWSESEVIGSIESLVSLLHYSPSWKENNMYTLVEMLSLLKALLIPLSQSTIIPSFIARLMIEGPFPRLIDSRCQPTIYEIYDLVAKMHGSQFLVTHVAYLTSKNISNAKLACEGMLYMQHSIEQHPSDPTDTSLIVHMGKMGLAHLQPSVREVTAILVTAASRVNKENLAKHMEEIKPQLRGALESSIDRVLDNQSGRHPYSTSASTKTNYSSQVSSKDNIDLTSNELVKKFERCADWQDYSKLLKLLESELSCQQKPIKFSCLGELVKHFCVRLEEPNKNIVLETLHSMLLLFHAIEGGIKPVCRVVIMSTMPLLGDLKPALRQAAFDLAEVCVQHGNFDTIVPVMLRGMCAESTHARQLALELALLFTSRNAPFDRGALSALLSPLLPLLLDKSAAIRGQAESMLEYVVPNVGYDAAVKATLVLKPVEQQLIRDSLDRFKGISSDLDVSITAQKNESNAQPTIHESVHLPQENRTNVHVDSGKKAAKQSEEVKTEVFLHVKKEGVIPVSAETSNLVPSNPSQGSKVGVRGELDDHNVHDFSKSNSTIFNSKPSPNVEVGLSAPMTLPTEVIPAPASHSLRESCHIIGYGAIEQALYQCQEWIRALQGTTPIACLVSEKEVSSLFRALLHRLHNVLENIAVNTKPAFQRLVGALQALAKRKDLVSRMRTVDLQEHFASMLQALLESNNVEDTSFSKSLNSLILSMIECSELSSCLESLILRLIVVTRSYFVSTTRSNHKLVEITVKCLLKAGRRMNQELPLEYKAVLSAAHRFLRDHPPSSFEGKDDLALRTIKTLLYDMTRISGPAVRTACEELSPEGSMISSFVELNLRKLSISVSASQSTPARNSFVPPVQLSEKQHTPWKAKPSGETSAPAAPIPNSTPTRSLAGAFTPQHRRAASPLTHPPGSGPHVTATPADDPLQGIFGKIRMLNHTEQGMRELYQYAKCNPTVDMGPHFYRCSEAFQTYIARRLKKYFDEDVRSGALPADFPIPIPSLQR